MATRSEFVNILEEVVANHGIYVMSGNGEAVKDLTLAKIYDMEKTYGDDVKKRMGQILSLLSEDYAKYDMSNAIACDCSGLIIYALRDRLGLLKSDMTASRLQSTTTAILVNEVRPGDLVFNKANMASHVGVYVGNGMVIESRGREYGVVKRKQSAGSWVAAGRFNFWDESQDTLTRTLKLWCKGDDVKMLESRLAGKGYYIGTEDQLFDLNTKDAVVEFQRKNSLDMDGIVGPKTAEALGFIWEG